MAQDDMRDDLRRITDMRDRWRAVIAEAEGQLRRLDVLYVKAAGGGHARHRMQGRPHLRVVRGAVIGAGLAAAGLLHKKAVAGITATAAASVMAAGLVSPAVSPSHLWHEIHVPALTAPVVHSLRAPRLRRRAEVRLAPSRPVPGVPGGRLRPGRAVTASAAPVASPDPVTASPAPVPSPAVSVSVPLPSPVPSVSVSVSVPPVRHLLPHPVRSLVPVLLPSRPPGCTVNVLGICVGVHGG